MPSHADPPDTPHHSAITDSVNAIVDPVTGMSALHVAAGINRMDLVVNLVRAGARFFPDKEGRWPSTLALICEADEELITYIIEEEALVIHHQALAAAPGH